jgi:outer membrane receptor protein involved in Fe transport
MLSGAAICALYVPEARAQQAAEKSAALPEITVTAQRRSENLKDVPIAIQALTGDTLQQLNIENFDDLKNFTPNLTVGGYGPGQATISLRGLNIGGDLGGQGGGSVGAFPNVAVYLDDQSAQVPGHNLDLMSVDLQRVEVLEGPQGTLFGSGAEAGVVRYITNKPKLDVTEAIVNAGVAGTQHGAMSTNADATLNIPLINNTLAARIVIYDDRRGGYIDNVPGTFVRQSGDLGIHVAGYTNNVPGPATPTNSVNNNALVGKNINPVTYQGVRGELYWKFNDDWNALFTQSFQNMDAEGVFYEQSVTSGLNPVALPPLSVQIYNPSYDKDKFSNSALTINGRIGELNVVYSGAYLIRNTEQVQDYTNYSRGAYADYYQCLTPKQTGTGKGICYSPSATWHDKEEDSHWSQEVRVSTPSDWRLRAIGGAFWEDFEVKDTTDFEYGAGIPGYTPIGPPPGASVINPNTRDINDGFFNDIKRGYTQSAAFASLDYDIIPKVLTVTGGTRFYRFDNFEKGAVVSGYSCYKAGPAPCTNGATNLDKEHLKSHYSGFKSRANITWHVTPDAMVYYTFSQGFRPGGFNRTANGTSYAGFKTPIKFAPDTLVNNEIGYKTQWFNRRLEVDGAFYQEDWSNVQDRFFDPGVGLGNLSFTANGPDYRVRGFETQVTGRVTQDLTLFAGGAINQSNQLNSPYLVGNAGNTLTQVANPFGKAGNTLAQSPLFKGNIRARYEFDYGDYVPFLQASVNHSTHTHSAVTLINNYFEAGTTTADFSMGVSKDKWSLQAYVNNLTNEHSQEFISTAQFVHATIINRPLTAGMRLNYTF